MNGKRAAIVAIGAELIMAASIGLSGVIGLHGHASASAGNWAPDYRTEVTMWVSANPQLTHDEYIDDLNRRRHPPAWRRFSFHGDDIPIDNQA